MTAIDVYNARVAYKDAAIEEMERLCNGLENIDEAKVALLEKAYDLARDNAQARWLEYVEVVRRHHQSEATRLAAESLEQVGETEWVAGA